MPGTRYVSLVKHAICSLLLLVQSAAIAADDPASDYPPALARLQASHRAVAQGWYRLLDSSQPARGASLVRLEVPRFATGALLRVEFVLAPEMPRQSTAWVYAAKHLACPCDGEKLAYDAAAGTLKGTFTVALPAGFGVKPGTGKTAALVAEGVDSGFQANKPEEAVIAIDAAVTGGRVTGTFACEIAGTKGAVTGEVVTPAAAASAVRGLPDIDLKRTAPADAYALAVALERDTVEMYRWIRAMTAAGGDRGKFAPALVADAVPIPKRPGFMLPAEPAEPKPATPATPPRGKGAKPTKPGPKAPSIDDSGSLGDEPAPKAGPNLRVALEKSTRARLPLMDAMDRNTASLADLVARALEAQGPKSLGLPAIQRGKTFDDPLFGPWYGTGSLAPAGAAVNRLPADAGAAGVQDWPFVHAWQFVGPFGFTPPAWDPIRLPDCLPAANTEYAGNVGPVQWRPAEVAPSGCAVLTDLDSYAAASDGDIEQEPNSPAHPRPVRTAVYYAATTIQAQGDIELLLAAGCCGRLAVWIDDLLVARGPAGDHPEDITKETLLFPAKLHKGANRVLVRCEAAAYGLFTHRIPGTASYFWVRACVRGAPGDAKAGQAWLDAVAKRKKDLPNLPPNVRGFRGDQTGNFADADPVTAWDIDRGINVRWTAPIERWGKSAPLVVGDKVFVCAEPHVLICLDAQDGKFLWRASANVLELINPALGAASEKLHQAYIDAKAAAAPRLAELGPNYASRLRALEAKGTELPRAVVELRALEADAEKAYQAFFRHLGANTKLVAPAWDGHYSGPWLGYTFATPVTDGKRVYVQFRTGATAAFDLDGKRAWMIHTPYETGGVGVCSSPVLADDKLVISQAGEGGRTGAAVKLTALDAATGRTVWTAKADSRSQISSPVVMRLTDGKGDMTVVVTDGGTVVRADDGKVLVSALRGGCGTGSPTPVGDVLYRVELSQGGAVQLVMLDGDHVGARWLWSTTGMYNAIYAGLGYHDGTLFGTCHGGSQCIGPRGLDLIAAATGLPIDRPFNNYNPRDKTNRKGIFITARFGFVPPVASQRAIYLAIRGQGHASSLQEELPGKWTPYSYVSVAQHGRLGRFIAHNKVVAPLTPHLALAGDRVYIRNDQELTCFGYTGEEGKVYEAEVNAATILDDVADEPPADAQAAALWREGLAHARPFLERVIALKPACPAAVRAKTLLARLGGR